MRNYLAAGLLALSASPALAGGVERSNQSMAILFEQGNYLEFGASYTRPRVSGVSNTGFGPAGNRSSGNMAGSFWNLDLRLRGDITEQLSYAIIIDQPIGADVAYPTGTFYPIEGSSGTIRSTALTGVLRYALDGGFSAYGGVRAVRTRGNVELRSLGGPTYTMSTNNDTRYGFLLGVAYEIPDIAARVSLTYNSRVTHKFDSVETIGGGAPIAGSFNTSIPESVHLEFQTGIMEDTLLFGGVRWVRWNKFDITPPTFTTLVSPGNSLVDYAKPTVTYTIGVGRRFNENWSGSVSLTHEPKTGGIVGNLGPTDGFTAIGVGASYSIDNIRISGGVQYRRIGSATTQIQGLQNRFTGNSAVSVGMRVGMSF